MELAKPSDSEADESITASIEHSKFEADAPESTSALIRRLQNAACDSPVGIYFSRNKSVRPAVVSESSLSEVSPKYFAKCFDEKSPYARFKEEDDEGQDRSFSFSEYSPDTIKIFLYWLTHRKVPSLNAFDMSVLTSRSDWQILLARSWDFAEEKQIPQMQNDVMGALVPSLYHLEMTQDVLQTILKNAQSFGPLRAAVLEEALFLKADGCGLLEGLDTNVFGFTYDMNAAKAAFRKRKGRRGRVEDYLVKV